MSIEPVLSSSEDEAYSPSSSSPPPPLSSSPKQQFPPLEPVVVSDTEDKDVDKTPPLEPLDRPSSRSPSPLPSSSSRAAAAVAPPLETFESSLYSKYGHSEIDMKNYFVDVFKRGDANSANDIYRHEIIVKPSGQPKSEIKMIEAAKKLAAKEILDTSILQLKGIAETSSSSGPETIASTYFKLLIVRRDVNSKLVDDAFAKLMIIAIVRRYFPENIQKQLKAVLKEYYNKHPMHKKIDHKIRYAVAYTRAETAVGDNIVFVVKEKNYIPFKLIMCQKCGVEISKGMCGRCRNAYYCTKKCYIADWDTHKIVCIKKK